MCTVTYIPHHNGYLLTSSRDERFSRPAALPPAEFKLEGRTLLYPKDPEGKQKLVARTEAQLARIPRHEVVLAPAARHFVMLDSPELFFGKIDSFLAANARTR